MLGLAEQQTCNTQILFLQRFKFAMRLKTVKRVLPGALKYKKIPQLVKWSRLPRNMRLQCHTIGFVYKTLADYGLLVVLVPVL